MAFFNLIRRGLPAVVALALSLIASQVSAAAMREPGHTANWAVTPAITADLDAPLSDAEPPPPLAKPFAAAKRAEPVAQNFVCAVTAASCNYQPLMTPVRNQGRCASCWVFATMGAWEGTYALRYGVQIDASEQQMLNCTGRNNTCAGGFWGDALALMTASPIGPEAAQPYRGKSGKCQSNPASPYKVAAWGFISVAATPPPVAALKQALVEHGPVIAGISATSAFEAYTGGVFNETGTAPIDHAVVIVGWDDQRQAWRVRNSRGTAWGEAGYAWVAFGSNNLGAWATWVQPEPPGAVELIKSSSEIAVIVRNRSARLAQSLVAIPFVAVNR
jgi:hypothetical protein